MPKTVKSVSKNYSVNDSYNLRPNNLEKIINTLEFARDNIQEAVAFSIVVKIEESFDIKRMSKLIKSKLQSYGYAIAYSIEYGARAGLHIHLMVCVSSRGNRSPITLMYKIAEWIGELEGVRSTSRPARKPSEDVTDTNNTTPKHLHRLNKEDEFLDAVVRYSYMSKNNSKSSVQRTRKFGTSKAKGTSKKVNVI